MTATVRRRLVVGGVAALLAATGTTMIALGVGRPGMRPPMPVTAHLEEVSDGFGPPSATPLPTLPALPAYGPSIPVHLDIPAIGVHTAVMVLGNNPDGTMGVPPLGRNAPAGWYRYLPTPGEVGPAVILGHVDTDRYGPAVFFRLGRLRPGDIVLVHRVDGTTVVFSVVSVAIYRKTAFPSETVYGPIDHPGLRLITCGGSFDRSRHRYRANVVVYAALTRGGPARHPGR